MIYTLQKQITSQISKIFFRILLSVCVLFFLLCTGDYNPFGDFSVSKAIIFSKLKNNDSLSIFSTETLTVKCAAVDQIKKFMVHVEKNRFFSDTTIHYHQFDLSSLVSFNFLISFYDTGKVTIKVTTYRTNGDIVSDSVRFNVYQPLKVQNKSENTENRIKLFTVPVNDNKVIYHWKFEEIKEVKTERAYLDTVIASIPSAGKGRLWVTDLHEKFASPSVPFTFSFSDTIHPVIECLNATKNDTIFTSEKVFTFFAKIYSASYSKIDAVVNGESFTRQEGQLFIKEITFTNNNFALNVTARSESGVTSTKTYVVKYDPSISNSLNLEVNCPDTSRGIVFVWGKVQQFYSPQIDIIIKASVNGTFYESSQNIKAATDAAWQFKLPLDTNNQHKKNLIEIAVYNTSDSLLVRDTAYVEYNKSFIDTLPPVIVDLSADYNNFTNNKLIVTTSNPRLRLIAFDGSGIKKVLVNETDITQKATENFIWEFTVNVSHSEYHNFTIKVIDSLNDAIDTTVSMLYNIPPQVISTFDSVRTIIVDSLYTQKIEAIDLNRDSIQFEKVSTLPEKMNVGSDGVISWTPTINDTGFHKIEIRIKDRYSYSTLKFILFVSKEKEQPLKVIGEKDFPTVVEVNDTLCKAIISDAVCGTTPLYFSGITSNQKQLTFENCALKWTPDSTDTGLVQLAITVKKHLINTTIMPVLRVLPAFRENNVTFSWTGDTTVNGSLDLRNPDKSDTLTIIVTDPSIMFRNFTASIKYNSEKPYSVRIDSTAFYKLIFGKKRKNSGTDTLTIDVKDTLGNNVHYVKHLDYGIFQKPVITKPIKNSVLADSAVVVSWNRCGDSGIVQYRVSVFQNDSVILEKTVSDTQLTVFPKENENYCLRVTAVKNGQELSSDNLLFIYNYFKKITITTFDTISKYYIAAEDSLKISLHVINEHGRPTFKTCGENATLFTVDQNGTVIFKPEKEGVYSLSVAVTDAAGYSDTFTISPVLVIPKNRPCKLLSSPAIDTLIDPSDNITYTFTISDPDTIFAEKYTVKVKMYNTETIKEIGPERIFTITVKALDTYNAEDSLVVIVTDKGNFSDTIKAKLGSVNSSKIKYTYPRGADIVDINDYIKFQWTGQNIPEDRYFYIQIKAYDMEGVLFDSLELSQIRATNYVYSTDEIDPKPGWIIYFVNAIVNDTDTIFGDTIKVTTMRSQPVNRGEIETEIMESTLKAKEVLFKEE